MRNPNPARPVGGGWGLAVLAVAVILLAPLLICPMPALGDYPNHLARAFILSRLPDDPVLGRMYAAHWSVIPNLGLDVVMPPLMRWLPVHVVGRLVIGLSALLTVLGATAMNRALAPGEPGGRWWSLGSALCAWAGCLLVGYVNFVLSLGLAMLLGAAWLRWREARATAVITLAVVAAPVLFFCHLMGLLFFGAVAGAAELSRLRPFAWRAALRRGLVLALVFAVPAALYAMSALSDLGGDAIWLDPAGKLLQMQTAFVTWSPGLDAATTVLAFGVPLAATVLRRGWFPAPAALAVGVLAAVYAVAPFGWKGTYQLDTRLAVMLGWMMFAGFVPRRWPRPAIYLVTVAMLGLFGARTAELTLAWTRQARMLTDIATALAPVRPGQTVMTADPRPIEAPGYWRADPYWLRLSDGEILSKHLGALALIGHHAFWPYEFDNPSQQPLRTRQPYQALTLRLGALPDRAELLRMNLCGFDIVLLTNAEAVPRLPADRFQLLASHGFAQSYRVLVCNPT